VKPSLSHPLNIQIPEGCSYRFKAFPVEEVFFFINIKVEKKGINQPPRPGNEPCKSQIINGPGHPSFKRRGNLRVFNAPLKLTPMSPTGGI